MKIKKKIGWQKYEDVIESQIDSPLLDALFQKIHSASGVGVEDKDDNFYNSMDDEESEQKNQIMIPLDNRLVENITLAQNFECWLAHTNFNITKEIRNKLNRTEGVELLKICSRYRFFIGIGRMFSFKEVRKNIEDLFNGEGELINEKL